jgi:hypothetical protein
VVQVKLSLIKANIVIKLFRDSGDIAERKKDVDNAASVYSQCMTELGVAIGIKNQEGIAQIQSQGAEIQKTVNLMENISFGMWQSHLH